LGFDKYSVMLLTACRMPDDRPSLHMTGSVDAVGNINTETPQNSAAVPTAPATFRQYAQASLTPSVSLRQLLNPLDRQPSVTLHRTVNDALDDPTSELNSFLDTKGKPLMTAKAWFYSLILEDSEVRGERIVSLAEAFAVFGTLFLNGLWFVWDFGSDDFENKILREIFGLTITLGIICNIFLAMFSGFFLWIMSSIMYSGSHTNWWVYGARY
jgi:hypothetical protein